MSYKVSANHEKEAISLVGAYTEEIKAIMARNRDVVQIEADLGACLLGGPAGVWSLPEGQIFDVGIQEANMVGVACGMSGVGKIPFIHSFAPFVARRANDVIAISGCYNKASVKMIGSDPGFFNANCGGTHTCYEDIGVLRSIHNITILDIDDSTQLRSVVRQMENFDGMVYIRMARKNVEKIYEEGSEFEIGKAALLRPVKDVTIIASGIMVSEALKAAATLANEGIDARVLNMFTWTPLDMEAVAAAALDTGAIVTCENHNILCGLGSAVCEAVCSMKPVPVERVGINDVFGEVGTEGWLKEHFNLNAANIIAHAKKAIARK